MMVDIINLHMLNRVCSFLADELQLIPNTDLQMFAQINNHIHHFQQLSQFFQPINSALEERFALLNEGEDTWMGTDVQLRPFF
jgi:hypothetical protein